MIIRATLKSNLYTPVLEKYFSDKALFLPEYYNSKAEYEQFKRDVKKLNKYKLHSSEKEKFKIHLENAICKNFINYINAIDESSNWHTKRFNARRVIQYKEFILENLEIKLVNLIVDTTFNKEVVFYIYQSNKYITL